MQDSDSFQITFPYVKLTHDKCGKLCFPKNIQGIVSRTSLDSYTDTTGINLEQFLIATLNRNMKDRSLLLSIEQDIYSFISDTSWECLRFPEMSSYQRMLVHRVAAYFGLDHNVDSSGMCVIVNKSKNTRIPDLRFCDYLKSDLDEPRRILKRDLSFQNNFAKSVEFTTDSDCRHSKSFEEREEEYEKAKKRIFNQKINFSSHDLTSHISNSNLSHDLDISKKEAQNTSSVNLNNKTRNIVTLPFSSVSVEKMQSLETNSVPPYFIMAASDNYMNGGNSELSSEKLESSNISSCLEEVTNSSVMWTVAETGTTDCQDVSLPMDKKSSRSTSEELYCMDKLTNDLERLNCKQNIPIQPLLFFSKNSPYVLPHSLFLSHPVDLLHYIPKDVEFPDSSYRNYNDTSMSEPLLPTVFSPTMNLHLNSQSGEFSSLINSFYLNNGTNVYLHSNYPYVAYVHHPFIHNGYLYSPYVGSDFYGNQNSSMVASTDMTFNPANMSFSELCFECGYVPVQRNNQLWDEGNSKLNSYIQNPYASLIEKSNKFHMNHWIKHNKKPVILKVENIPESYNRKQVEALLQPMLVQGGLVQYLNPTSREIINVDPETVVGGRLLVEIHFLSELIIKTEKLSTKAANVRAPSLPAR